MGLDPDANKPLWEALAKVHERSGFYDLEGFIQHANSLPAVDDLLLGEIHNKRILHLQCHIGTESISMAKRGALVTAVDFSEKAISIANQLAQKMDTHVDFKCHNIYDLDHIIPDQSFDIIYSSYGVVTWLYDLNLWAQLIRKKLTEGGRFILVEFHPILFTFDEPGQIKYNYGSKMKPEKYEMRFSYTGDALDQPYTEYCWNHSIAQVMRALRSNHLKLVDFQEYDYSPQPCFNDLIEFEPGKFRFQAFDKISFPYVYSMVFEK